MGEEVGIQKRAENRHRRAEIGYCVHILSIATKATLGVVVRSARSWRTRRAKAHVLNGRCTVKLARSVLEFVRVLTICLFVSGISVGFASAQVLYGSVVGTLKDATGAVVPGATVMVKSQSTGLSREVVTDQSGYYSIPNLPEGSYDLSVTANGFKPYTQTGLGVRINAVTRADVSIELGGVAEEVSVEATSAVLQTATTDVSTNLDTRAMMVCPPRVKVVSRSV